MQLCDRCDGGERLGNNCPACGGSGMVEVGGGSLLISRREMPPVSDAFRHQQSQAARIAREEEKRRPVKQYRIPDRRPRLTKEERAAIKAAYIARKKQEAALVQEKYMAQLNKLTLAPKTRIEEGS